MTEAERQAAWDQVAKEIEEAEKREKVKPSIFEYILDCRNQAT